MVWSRSNVRRMSDWTASDASDGIPIELAGLRNTVACELHAQLAMRGEMIALADVPEVAYAVAVRLGHEFRIECAPSRQDHLEDDDSLGLDGAAFYASAMPNGDSHGPSDRYPIFDHGWPSRS
jgi:hypothetical protein